LTLAVVHENPHHHCLGGVAERSNAAVLKTARATAPGCKTLHFRRNRGTGLQADAPLSTRVATFAATGDARMTAKTPSLSVAARRAKKALDYHTSLWEIPAVHRKPRYPKVGGMKLLDRDRRVAQAALRREYALYQRVAFLRARIERTKTK
jgi:hypothetical protein